MPLWQKLGVTIVAMVGTSLIAGLIWSAIFDATLPSYIAGLIGGITSVPVWEFLRRVKPKDEVA